MPERSIAGRTISCEPLPAAQALDLLARFTKAFAPGSGMLTALIDSEEVAMFGNVVRAAASFIGGMNAAEVTGLALEMVKLCREDGQPVDPAQLVLKDVPPLFAFAIEVQFKDFFAESPAGGLLEALRAAVPSPSAAANSPA